tara:strand:- start:61149 stop:66260 length:5112 start_codon:yes stop_codon:yes gene_type:complete
MKKLFTLVVMLVSVSLSAQTVYMPNDIFENVAEGNGWGDGILGNDSVDAAAISAITNLDLSNLLIDDYTGLEGFTSLTNFDCSNVANQGIANVSIPLLTLSSQLLTFDASGNPLLFCIEVDDTAQANTNVTSGLWTIDSHASFSNDCGSAFGCLDPAACNWAPTYSIDTISGSSFVCNYEVTTNVTIDSCDSFSWDGVSYDTTGIYTNVYTAQNGCDSTVNLDLTIRYSTQSTTIETVCDYLIWNGVQHDSSGTYEYFTSNSVGCDSTAILVLTVNRSSSGSSIVTACDIFTWDGTTYTSSVVDTKIYTNAAGCDSIHVLNLTINNSNSSSTTITSCDIFTWDGVIYDSTGTYTNNYTNVLGCDSTHTLNLTITNSTSGSSIVTACDTFTWDGTTYTSSVFDTKIYTNSFGCDSIHSLDLTINNSQNGSSTVTACDFYTWEGQTVTSSDVLIHTYQNGADNGCDSTHTLNVIVNYSTNAFDTVVACNSYSVGGATYDTSGVYFYQISNVAGCDSNIILTLNINYTDTSWNGQSTFNTVEDSACDFYTWNGITYTTSLTSLGIGSHLLEFNTQTNPGCDSTAFQNLYLGATSSDTTTVFTCEDYYWINIYGDTLFQMLTQGIQTYTVTYTNEMGCDSVHVLDVTYNEAFIATNSPTDTLACEQFVDLAGNIFTTTVLNQSIVVGQGTNGCDSVLNYNIFIASENRVDTFVTSCDDYLWDRTGTTYTSSTVDSVVFSAYAYFNGGLDSILCDSTIYLNLTINNSIFISESDTVCDSYLWTVNGNTYDSSSTYTQQFFTVDGCDSIHELNLVVNYSSSTSLVDEGCDNEEYTWTTADSSYVLNSTGLYIVTSTNSSGCIHTDSLDLTINPSFSDSLTPFNPGPQCDFYHWPVGNSGQGVTYVGANASGLKASYFTNLHGCDSVHWLDLTIEETQSYSYTNVACDNFNWQLAGTSYSSSGTYTFTEFTSQAGCTITHTLNLTINNSSANTVSVVACDSYEWDGVTYDSSGAYINTYADVNGCDSVVTLNLTINISSIDTVTVQVCDFYVWDTVTYNTTGTYTNNYTDINGCDSIVILDLTIINTNNTTVFDTACHTYTWALASQNYDSTGVYPYLGNTNACGGIDTVFLNLVVNERVYGSGSVTVCNSYEWNGNAYTSSGTYVDTLISSVGCDSVATLNLTVNYNDTSSVLVSHNQHCDTLFIENDALTSDGIHYVLANQPTVNGCDSIIIVDLILNYTQYIYDTITVCGEFYWYSDTITQSGTHSQIFLGNDSTICDVIEILEVTVVPEYTDIFDSQVHCDSYTWIDGVTYTSSNNSATYTYQTNAGCDSTIHLDLTINYSSNPNSSSIDTLCVPYLWGTVVIDSAGTFTETFVNTVGCDSIHTVTINYVLHKTEGISNITACDMFEWDNITYTSSGSYHNTYTNSVGCDSLHTLILTIINSNSGSSSETSCEFYVWNGDTLNATGVYTDTLTNIDGCDSVATLNLVVLSVPKSTETHITCDPFTWVVDGQTYTSSGMYSYTYVNGATNGCDSTVTLDLTINDAPTVVGTQIAGSLKWEAIITDGVAPFIVTWVDPNAFTSNLSPLEPITSGWFSVFVEDANGCISNIDSFYVDLPTSILFEDIKELNIYPNPTSDYINLEFTSKNTSDYNVRIISSSGNEVYIKEVHNFIGNYKSSIDLSRFAKGNYLIEISNSKDKIYKKLLLQ